MNPFNIPKGKNTQITNSSRKNIITLIKQKYYGFTGEFQEISPTEPKKSNQISASLNSQVRKSLPISPISPIKIEKIENLDEESILENAGFPKTFEEKAVKLEFLNDSGFKKPKQGEGTSKKETHSKSQQKENEREKKIFGKNQQSQLIILNIFPTGLLADQKPSKIYQGQNPAFNEEIQKIAIKHTQQMCKPVERQKIPTPQKINQQKIEQFCQIFQSIQLGQQNLKQTKIDAEDQQNQGTKIKNHILHDWQCSQKQQAQNVKINLEITTKNCKKDKIIKKSKDINAVNLIDQEQDNQREQIESIIKYQNSKRRLRSRKKVHIVKNNIQDAFREKQNANNKSDKKLESIKYSNAQPQNSDSLKRRLSSKDEKSQQRSVIEINSNSKPKSKKQNAEQDSIVNLSGQGSLHSQKLKEVRKRLARCRKSLKKCEQSASPFELGESKGQSGQSSLNSQQEWSLDQNIDDQIHTARRKRPVYFRRGSFVKRRPDDKIVFCQHKDARFSCGGFCRSCYLQFSYNRRKELERTGKILTVQEFLEKKKTDQFGRKKAKVILATDGKDKKAQLCRSNNELPNEPTVCYKQNPQIVNCQHKNYFYGAMGLCRRCYLKFNYLRKKIKKSKNEQLSLQYFIRHRKEFKNRTMKRSKIDPSEFKKFDINTKTINDKFLVKDPEIYKDKNYICGHTQIKYYARGLCHYCYHRYYTSKNEGTRRNKYTKNFKQGNFDKLGQPQNGIMIEQDTEKRGSYELNQDSKKSFQDAHDKSYSQIQHSEQKFSEQEIYESSEQEKYQSIYEIQDAKDVSQHYSSIKESSYNEDNQQCNSSINQQLICQQKQQNQEKDKRESADKKQYCQKGQQNKEIFLKQYKQCQLIQQQENFQQRSLLQSQSDNNLENSQIQEGKVVKKSENSPENALQQKQIKTRSRPNLNSNQQLESQSKSKSKSKQKNSCLSKQKKISKLRIRRRGTKCVPQCGHPQKKYGARGFCVNCFQYLSNKYKTKQEWPSVQQMKGFNQKRALSKKKYDSCGHDTAKYYARGMCLTCYKQYHKNKMKQEKANMSPQEVKKMLKNKKMKKKGEGTWRRPNDYIDINERNKADFHLVCEHSDRTYFAKGRCKPCYYRYDNQMRKLKLKNIEQYNRLKQAEAVYQNETPLSRIAETPDMQEEEEQSYIEKTPKKSRKNTQSVRKTPSSSGNRKLQEFNICKQVPYEIIVDSSDQQAKEVKKTQQRTTRKSLRPKKKAETNKSLMQYFKVNPKNKNQIVIFDDI